MGEDLDPSAAGKRIKAYKIAVEYRYMKAHAPGGVYVLPSFEDIRRWHGVIFVRRSHYANGIFRFRMELPEAYNDEGTWPRIFFTGEVFNPLVDPRTGEVQLQYFLPKWDPTQHFVITALTSLKKIFYFKLDVPEDRLERWYTDASCCVNPEAARMAREDRRKFHEQIQDCVVVSQTEIHMQVPESPLNFPARSEEGEELIAGLAMALFDQKSGNRTTRHAKSILGAVTNPPKPPSADEVLAVRIQETTADEMTSGAGLGVETQDAMWEPQLPAYFWTTEEEQEQQEQR